MKILILCPGKIPQSVSDIRCFTESLNYYIPRNLSKLAEVDIQSLPLSDNKTVLQIFEKIEPKYDCILALGLRYFGRVPPAFLQTLRDQVKCPIVQMHDGTRFDSDGVDLTLTFKETENIPPHRAEAHSQYNKCVGWAADCEIFDVPTTKSNVLTVLVDHTNYNGGEDFSNEVLTEVFNLKESDVWKGLYDDVVVKRLGSGVFGTLDSLPYEVEPYDRKKVIPITELAETYRSADIFVVSHPESLGLVVLETAMCGSLVVCKQGFVSKDRLNSINHYCYSDEIIWDDVLPNINRRLNRDVAIKNSWSQMATNIINELTRLVGKL